MTEANHRSVDNHRTVDVLDVSDLRFPGGTSHSIAEEIAAQAAAGYTTGLVQLNGPLVAKVSPVNAQLRAHVEAGRARLLLGSEPIDAGVVVVRHPAVLQHAADQLPPIRTEHVVVVANAAPHDIDGHEHYQPELVDEIARRHFGVEPVWAPIGPLVRTSIAGRVPAGALRADDWVNVIDVDAWWVPRSGWQADRPVIGRHSRSSPQKWPHDAGVLRAVYPTDGSWRVRVLGGADPAKQVLGSLPDSWDVLPFGAISPREFLAGLDFFVYFHDPRWVEAFGRTILEAMASGVPAILPPHFAALFGDAAIYAAPDEVRGVVDGLHTDRAAYEAVAARATAAVRERFGHEAHVARIADLIGAPTASAVAASSPQAPTRTSSVRRQDEDRPRALFISSNGTGMGHLTRLLAYARRVEPELAPHFLSLSQAVPVVGRFGFPFEYLPSAKATGLKSARWHKLFAARVAETVGRVRPEVVVFDGTWPYEGIPVARQAHPDVPWVWSRRGMWRAGHNRDQLAKAEWFDEVVEPGDFAAEFDAGVTVNAAATRVGPVTLLDSSELEDRATARAALGLDADAPLALVSLGAGTINDTSGDIGAVVAALRSLGVGVCVTKPEIALGSPGDLHDVHVVSDFPLSRHYRAFDLAVSATGYNSFHELLRFEVPTLFVPNRATALDDQEARAQFAAERGLGLAVDAITVETAKPLLAELLDRGPAMVAGIRDYDSGNGAADAAGVLRRLASLGGR